MQNIVLDFEKIIFQNNHDLYDAIYSLILCIVCGNIAINPYGYKNGKLICQNCFSKKRGNEVYQQYQQKRKTPLNNSINNNNNQLFFEFEELQKNEFAKRFIQNLLLTSCINKKQGCEKQFLCDLKLINKHEQICEYNINLKEIQVTTQIEKHNTSLVPHKDFQYLVMKQFECAICFGSVSRIPHSCELGHLHCQSCFKFLKNCSVCRQKLSTEKTQILKYKNLFAEKAIQELLTVKCSNFGYGCNYIFNLSINNVFNNIYSHESQKCEQRLIQCLHCNQKFQGKEVSEHFRRCKQTRDRAFEIFVQCEEYIQEFNNHHQVPNNIQKQNTGCPYQNCLYVQKGICEYYHQKCDQGKACNNLKTQNCPLYHPIEEIYCKKNENCLEKQCSFYHDPNCDGDYQQNEGEYNEALQQNQKKLTRHQKDFQFMCLSHSNLPLFCSNCQVKHSKCQSVLIISENKVIFDSIDDIKNRLPSLLQNANHLYKSQDDEIAQNNILQMAIKNKFVQLDQQEEEENGESQDSEQDQNYAENNIDINYQPVEQLQLQSVQQQEQQPLQEQQVQGQESQPQQQQQVQNQEHQQIITEEVINSLQNSPQLLDD